MGERFAAPTAPAAVAAVLTSVLCVLVVTQLIASRLQQSRQRRQRRTKLLRIGCGAGYQGDRVLPAAELIGAANPSLDYLFLECLAERTLAIAHARMAAGGPGYDPRLPQWLATLLPI